MQRLPAHTLPPSTHCAANSEQENADSKGSREGAHETPTRHGCTHRGLNTLSKIGFTSSTRNAAIAPTTAISTTDAKEYSAYGRTYSSNRQIRFKPPLSRSSSSHCASHHSICAPTLRPTSHHLPRHVPMSRLHRIPFLSQTSLHLLCNEHGPMLPPGAFQTPPSNSSSPL